MFIFRLSLLLISFNGLATELSPNLGRPASAQLIKQWNMDIFPDGKGLPKGQGNAIEGKTVYEKHCLLCHGLEGTGDSADELAGAMHSLTDQPPDKTIGNYWPFATTLFDFTRRAMPLNNPGKLDNNALYAVTAYLLYLNHIIDINLMINATNLPKINMPNRHGFINVYQKEK